MEVETAIEDKQELSTLARYEDIAILRLVLMGTVNGDGVVFLLFLFWCRQNSEIICSRLLKKL